MLGPAELIGFGFGFSESVRFFIHEKSGYREVLIKQEFPVSFPGRRSIVPAVRTTHLPAPDRFFHTLRSILFMNLLAHCVRKGLRRRLADVCCRF